ncbi:MAG TPA: type IV pilus twitching motility protein PilT [Gemmatimonadaceae bacterium]|nr:type IV pilus twitching motility protein PilT [Gemmatimonadaceae bacterium]
MAQLDRLLAAVVQQGADELRLASDDAAHIVGGGASRPLTRQALSTQQVLALLREIAPAEAAREMEAGRPVSFRYTTPEGSFVARLAEEGGRWSAAITLEGRGTLAQASGEHRAVAGLASRDGPRVGPTDGRKDGPREEMEALLVALVEGGGSDLHLRCGEPPIIRKDGELVRLEGGPLSDDHLVAMLGSIMPTRNRGEFEETNDTDFAYEIDGVARFRANALRERKGCAAVFRVIPSQVVTADQLGLSDAVRQLCQLTKGLVLVTGPTGSGKSTTLCAMIDLVNSTRSEHVLTIEDPIEFVHPNKRCLVTQRQVGVHTGSFKSALRAALREDPDIVLVGELRDLETVSIAIETAETGHLVFGTLHTTTAPGTIDRLIDQFPADRQEQIRVMLSESLKGVISQTLCKKIGGGRVAAQEILLSIPAVSNLIREGKTFQIPSIMQTSRRHGMVTLNDALMEHVEAGRVTPLEAYTKAVDKAALASTLRARGHDTSFTEPDGGAAGAGAKPQGR